MSFFKAFGKNMAAYAAGRALAANEDKVKQFLGFDSEESEGEPMEDEKEKFDLANKKAEEKLQQELEKRIAKLPPDRQKKLADRVRRMKGM